MKARQNIKSVLVLVFVFALLGACLAIYHAWDKVFAKAGSSDDVTAVFSQAQKKVFEPVLPNEPVVLPDDFQFQNEYQHEWWHFFANVTDQFGESYGIQWSYFRIANDEHQRTGWQNPQLYVSHVVISNQYKTWKEQRIARGGIGQAGMTQKPFRIWIDNWSWRSLGMTPFPGQLQAATDTFRLDLRTMASGPFVLPGDRGYVEKHDLLPIASYNLSVPFLNVNGYLQLTNGKVLKVQGSGWMSKEWGSGLMAEGQQGWDWFVIHLDGERTLSVNRYRHEMQLPHVFGTLSTNDGKVITLTEEQLQVNPLRNTTLSNGKVLPLDWEIKVPAYGIDVTTKPMNTESWLPFVIPYWEGAIVTEGSHQAKGFMQSTGY
ncbi:lipocalin-like domain-containing protein [Vibrio sp. TRT 21S02]|uniref:lipocalin-like domain-containing protein n=1 Tax=Vibrio sp. TRT 21S02 TaxID=3418507 RepID=UPI003CF2F6F1